MSEQPAKKLAAYEDLYSLPENVVGEIIDGEVHATPRPSYRHGVAASGLGIEIGSAYQFGRGGPGGWWILDEVEVQLGENLLVPDLAGWRRERLPRPPETNWTTVAPDWVCEVVSPRTARLDRTRKIPIYAQFGVSFLWILDPGNKTLEVFRLEDGRWVLASASAEDDKVRAEPFQEIEIDLKGLWWE